tara:strand:- start:618 stop:953 length:336 start_codon:yes stop_codon:yes gene_type:complete
MGELKEYIKGGEFSDLYNKACKFDKRISKSVKRQYENLVDAENGTGMKYLGTFEKQLKEIKKTLEKVFNIFLKQKMENENRKNIENCLYNVEYVKSSKDVYELVKIGNENT